MNKKSQREEIIRFILGEMDPGEAEAFETRLFAEDDLFYDTADTENTLADEYVRGQIPPTERKRFENALKRRASLREKVAEAGAVRSFVEEENGSVKTRAGLLDLLAQKIAEIFGSVLTAGSVLRLAGPAAAIILLAVGAFYIFELRRAPQNIASTEGPAAQATPQSRSPILAPEESPAPSVAPGTGNSKPGESSVSRPEKRPAAPNSNKSDTKKIRQPGPTPKKADTDRNDAPPNMDELLAKREDEVMAEAAAAGQGSPAIEYEKTGEEPIISGFREEYIDLFERPRFNLKIPELPLETKFEAFVNGEPVVIEARFFDTVVVSVEKNQLSKDKINRFELRTNDGRSFFYNLEVVTKKKPVQQN